MEMKKNSGCDTSAVVSFFIYGQRARTRLFQFPAAPWEACMWACGRPLPLTHTLTLSLMHEARFVIRTPILM
eukprot:scaffold11352_cov114-Isochrysis_galbana.AAC.2